MVSGPKIGFRLSGLLKAGKSAHLPAAERPSGLSMIGNFTVAVPAMAVAEPSTAAPEAAASEWVAVIDQQRWEDSWTVVSRSRWEIPYKWSPFIIGHVVEHLRRHRWGLQPNVRNGSSGRCAEQLG